MKFRLNTLDKAIKAKIDTIDTNEYELLPWTLYDIIDVDGAMDGSKKLPNTISFFQRQMGGTVGLEDTNMRGLGRIGSPSRFWGQYVRHAIYPAKNSDVGIGTYEQLPNDVHKSFINTVGLIEKNCSIELVVINKPYLQLAPLDQLPSGTTPSLAGVSTGSDRSYAFGSVRNMSDGAPIDMWLEGELQFFLDLKTSQSIPVYVPIRIGMFIDGILIRPRKA